MKKEITSSSNPLIKDVIKLRNRRERNQTDTFLIEGYRELLRASKADIQIEKLMICPSLFLGSNEQDLIDSIEKKQTEIIECSEQVFEKISYRDRPDGLLAIAKQFHYSFSDLSKIKNPLWVIAEAIEKPGNLGTILRSCDGVGAAGCMVVDPCTDIFNPNVVRASIGTLFTQPVLQLSSQEAYEYLKKEKIKIIATSPHAEKKYYEEDLSVPVAFVMGTEQYGLSSFWMEHADVQINIPMKHVADSLNVATATTIVLYEALRQRECHLSG